MAGSEIIAAGIADGSIDTVVLAFPDMHGRPVGKRVTADFFVSHVADHGIEVCDYLLAVDVDMEPLPGYRFANWDTGYGDLFDATGDPVAVSPRQILRHQIERAAERGLVVRCATELEFFLFRDSYEEAAAKVWNDLVPHMSTIEDYQILQTSREEYILRRV